MKCIENVFYLLFSAVCVFFLVSFPLINSKGIASYINLIGTEHIWCTKQYSGHSGCQFRAQNHKPKALNLSGAASYLGLVPQSWLSIGLGYCLFTDPVGSTAWTVSLAPIRWPEHAVVPKLIPGPLCYYLHLQKQKCCLYQGGRARGQQPQLTTNIA